MAQNRKSVTMYRCPWCFRKGNDSASLVYDAKKKEHYCQKCCFTGTEAMVREEYGRYQAKYRLMGKRLNILKELATP